MNPRPLLWLLLAGCAAPEPAKLPPSSCPTAHTELTRQEVRRLSAGESTNGQQQFRSPARLEVREGRNFNLTCGTCGYYLDGISQTWIREASTLDGFKHPPTPLVHSLVQRLPTPEALFYTHTHSPTELTESLQLATKLDAWAAILAQIEGLRGTGEITEEGPRREWKGSFGDGYFNIHVSSLNDRSSVYVFATSPAPT